MKKLGIIYAPRLSASAAALAAAVPLYRVGADGFKSRVGQRAYNRGGTLLNWGSTGGVILEERQGKIDCVLLNHREAVRSALSKLKTLTILKGAGIPALEATGDEQVARNWRDAGTILCRRDGLSGGRGIVKLGPDSTQAQEDAAIEASDFYVKYWKKTHEYRVHVFKDQIIDIQQKRRRTEWDGNYDPMIRNFDNGWVFCHDNIKGTETELQTLSSTSVAAVQALGLDFGAVDVLARYGNDGTLRKHVVCEINTAPGLEGQTLDKYVQAIRGYLNAL